MRKVELISPKNQERYSESQVCPFCYSLISPKLPPTGSVTEIPAAGPSLYPEENIKQEKQKNE